MDTAASIPKSNRLHIFSSSGQRLLLKPVVGILIKPLVLILIPCMQLIRFARAPK